MIFEIEKRENELSFERLRRLNIELHHHYLLSTDLQNHTCIQSINHISPTPTKISNKVRTGELGVLGSLPFTPFFERIA